MAVSGPWRLFAMPTNGTAPAKPLFDQPPTGDSEFFPAISPSEKFLAYCLAANPSQVFVRSLPASTGWRRAVSTEGGMAPIRSRDERELLFLASRGPPHVREVDSSVKSSDWNTCPRSHRRVPWFPPQLRRLNRRPAGPDDEGYRRATTRPAPGCSLEYASTPVAPGCAVPGSVATVLAVF